MQMAINGQATEPGTAAQPPEAHGVDWPEALVQMPLPWLETGMQGCEACPFG